MSLRVAAISFLNPAPLLYHFEHPPKADELRRRYALHYTTPARCAAELHAGDADLGLIPVAELTPDLAIVPGCAIASVDEVRSILLLVRSQERQIVADALRTVSVIAYDSASRSSAAYVRVILERFYGAHPRLVEQEADPGRMLAEYQAALLIGDHALLAREQRSEIEAHAAGLPGQSLLWLDLAQLWRQHTGLPWVAAVWAVRPQALEASGISAEELIADLNASREAGQVHIEELVREWTPRLPLSANTIRTYLTGNIHYRLDAACVQAIRTFRDYAAELNILPPLRDIRLLESYTASAAASGRPRGANLRL